MSGLFPILPPGVADRCRAFAAGLSIRDEQVEHLPERKGTVQRVRFEHGEDVAVRTEIRTLFTTRVIVNATPLGAVLVLLEIAKQGVAPGRLVALTGARAGEYPSGALEVAWGALMMERAGIQAVMGMRFPGEPRRLHVKQVVELAESILPP